MKIGRGRGWGKIILLGEHAVVYGVPAIAAALGEGVTATAMASGGRSQLSAAGWGLEAQAGGSSTSDRAFVALLQHLELEERGLRVVLEAGIPAGAGLGASAAAAVAAARALADLRGMPLDDEGAVQAAQASERVLHGNPSGIDSAVAARGGVIRFERERSLVRLRVGASLALVIGHSGRPGRTHQTVAAVAGLHRGRRAEVEARFAEIAELVDVGADALGRGDLPTLGQCLIENHARLQWLGVSSFELDRMVDLALDAGAHGAKLTGGGGGGCVIALVAGDPEPVEEAWAQAGFASFRAEIRATGLPLVGG